MWVVDNEASAHFFVFKKTLSRLKFHTQEIIYTTHLTYHPYGHIKELLKIAEKWNCMPEIWGANEHNRLCETGVSTILISVP